MLLVYGFGEYSFCYVYLVEYLNMKGIVVYIFDGRGYGKLFKFKVIVYFERVFIYVKDVDDFYKKMKEYVGEMFCFIFGYSMGGGMVV